MRNSFFVWYIARSGACHRLTPQIDLKSPSNSIPVFQQFPKGALLSFSNRFQLNR